MAFDPPPLIGASLVFDTADGYVLLFGGLYQSDQPSSQTWEYLSGRWVNITPFLGKAPSPRWDAVMVYDARDGYVLLFGGCGSPTFNGMCLNTASDTWEYLGGSWKQLLQPKSPPPPPGVPPPPATGPPSPGFTGTGLWDASATYDPSYRGGSVVVFGGASGMLDIPPPPPGPNTPPSTISVSGDTWSWSNGAWTNDTATVGSTPPVPEYGAGFAAGLSDGSAVLYGGANLTRLDVPIAPGVPAVEYDAGNVTGMVFNTTWILASSGTWSSIATVVGGPSARYDFAMALDPSGGGSVLMYGGTNSTGVFLSDSWRWFVPFSTGGPGPAPPPAWTPILWPPGPSPGPRWDYAFVYDTADTYFLLFGGRSVSGSALWDAWILGSLGWFPGNSQPVGFPAVPGPRYESSLTFDDLSRSAVLFGGERCGNASCAFLGDTWTFYNGEWRSWTPSLAPSPRYGAAMAYDAINDNVYLFGGCGSPCPMSDTWVYHQAGPNVIGTWTQLFPSISPPGRYFATLTFDPAVGGLLMFGGCEGALGPCPSADTWTLTGNGNWNNLALPPSGSPPARFGAAATFIPNSRLVLFGGMGSSGLLTDTWSYGPLGGSSAAPFLARSFASGVRIGWSLVNTVNNPPGRVFGTLSFDGGDHALVLSGGCGSAGCPSLAPWYFTLIAPKPPPPGQPPPPTTGPWYPVPGAPLWEWNLPPGAGYGTVTVWDPEGGPNGFILGAGGRAATGETMGSTFEFAGNAWYDLGPVS
ncbi:MAG TPA: kelch repeat-containing protein [Thermoplasmata archaeon]|nr:kelch repeat-containing protein [Thermoplasmata archaeon]